MRPRIRTGIAMAAVVYLMVASNRLAPPVASQETSSGTTPPAATALSGDASPQALVSQYCMSCHSDRVKSGGLALSELDLSAVGQHAEIAEKVIRKLRGG